MEDDVLMAAVACNSPSKKVCPENEEGAGRRGGAGSPDVLLKRLQDVVSERQSH